MRKSDWTLVVLIAATASLLITQYLTPLGGDDAISYVARLRADYVDGPQRKFQPNPLISTGRHVSREGSSRDPEYHVVFSTSCSEQQHWESMVFFYHAFKVKQPGSVTRIASGCGKKDAQQLKLFHRDYIASMSNSFHLHLTPDFSRTRLERGKHPYKYMNKPFGLRHWMEESLGLKENATSQPDLLNGIVILMDPDMILLRPLLHDFTNEEVIWVEQNQTSRATSVVRHGYPISQQDGYLNNEWMRLNFSYITNLSEGEYKTRPDFREGPLRWNTGPPYLATVRDMYRIVLRWTLYAPRVLDIHPKLFAEMYGFIHATVQLDLPFTLIKSLVVSTTKARDREGWAYIDSLPDDQVCSQPETSKLPIGLHYCDRYSNGKWFFSKYRVKKNIMNCEKFLLRPPPIDLVGKYNYGILPPRADLSDKKTYKEVHINTSARVLKREAYMLCSLTSAVNEALRFHKKQKCGNTANLNESYTVHDDPTNY